MFGHVLSPVIMFVIVVDVFFLRIPQYCCSDMKVTLGYGIWLLIKLKKKFLKHRFFFFFSVSKLYARDYFSVSTYWRIWFEIEEFSRWRDVRDREMFGIESCSK